MTPAVSEDWGPWKDHDGSGCPCVGEYVQTFSAGSMFGRWVHGKIAGNIWEGVATGKTGWVFGTHHNWVIRYRIRRPKGMEALDRILANLPEKVDA